MTGQLIEFLSSTCKTCRYSSDGKQDMYNNVECRKCSIGTHPSYFNEDCMNNWKPSPMFIEINRLEDHVRELNEELDHWDPSKEPHQEMEKIATRPADKRALFETFKPDDLRKINHAPNSRSNAVEPGQAGARSINPKQSKGTSVRVVAVESNAGGSGVETIGNGKAGNKEDG